MKSYLTKLALVLAMLMASLLLAQAGGEKNRQYPDVIEVKVQPRGANKFDFDVTISSPYDSPQRYANAFRVINADGNIYGERKHSTTMRLSSPLLETYTVC